MSDTPTLEQGDVLRIDVLGVVEERAGSLETTTRESATGLAVVISQTCDLLRESDLEPFIQVASIVEIDEKNWARSMRKVISPRQFALPPVAGFSHPVADLRVITTLDRRAVESRAVETEEIEFSASHRARFAEWVGRRFARTAFDDQLEEEVLGPLRDRLADRYESNQPDGAMVRSLEGVFVKQTNSAVEILLLVEPGTLGTSQLDTDEKVEQAKKTLLRPVFAQAKRGAGDWKIDVKVKEPAGVSAFDVLYSYSEIEYQEPFADVIAE